MDGTFAFRPAGDGECKSFTVHGEWKSFTLPAAQAGIFNDGYVRVDNTGDALGQTGYWGYQNASQYNAANNTLTMHSATSYTGTGSADVDFQPFVGIEAAYGMDLWNVGRAHIGWEVAAAFTPLRASDNESFGATVNQSAFTFNTTGIIVPTAPYSGGPSGVGEPTISNVETPAGTTNVTGTVSGQRKLDLQLYTFRVGPTVSWDFCKHLGVFAGLGPAIGILNGNYDFSENIVTAGGTAVNSGRIGMTKIVYGGYLNADLVYHAMDHGDVYIGAQFMPLSSSTVSGMGREARVDLSGTVQFSAGFNWPF